MVQCSAPPRPWHGGCRLGQETLQGTEGHRLHNAHGDGLASVSQESGILLPGRMTRKGRKWMVVQGEEEQ